MPQLNLSSNFGRVDESLRGKPQVAMRDALLQFFNFFLTTCRNYDIRDISLISSDIEYIYDDSAGRSVTWPLDNYAFEYLLNDILFEDSQLVDVEWIINWTMMSNFIFRLNYQNGAEFTDEMDVLFSPRTGQARINISFAPFVGVKSHHRKHSKKKSA
ncbi:hypothetical protein [Pantoea sp. CCBC3-3-1]|uniref:hypothetical protein n=1 Tax=Pantoea sp. CCBC3-3-1 TaxID=2490851 RepID=UPI0011BE9549|nr:hypothetical protein [Pantoea sp. CCBC3-3-1]